MAEGKDKGGQEGHHSLGGEAWPWVYEQQVLDSIGAYTSHLQKYEEGTVWAQVLQDGE